MRTCTDHHNILAVPLRIPNLTPGLPNDISYAVECISVPFPLVQNCVDCIQFLLITHRTSFLITLVPLSPIRNTFPW